MSSQIIKHTLVTLSSPQPSGPRGARSARDSQHGRKEARLVEIDGTPRAIEITCGCGEKTIVELVFDAPRSNEGGTKP